MTKEIEGVAILVNSVEEQTGDTLALLDHWNADTDWQGPLPGWLIEIRRLIDAAHTLTIGHAGDAFTHEAWKAETTSN